MRWRDSRSFLHRLVGLPIVLAAAALLAGCFQPLYSERPAAGDGPSLRGALSAVDIAQIDAPANSSEARLAVQIRNDLIFNFTGGSSLQSSTHKLIVRISGGRQIVSVDRTSALPNIENYALAAYYTLTEIATGKIVVTGRASTTVSYDTLGQQRFARISGMHDAERRAAKVISDNITTRLASYFVAGS
jgi:LPS-assembly lipoprotein